MSATANFSYASHAGYAFDWMENETWNDPALRSPIPCRAGYNCTYSGVCSFVHPGEEGAGRRLFPARSAEEKDMVRLYHPTKKPEYYRRRELRLSWPEWCARQGLPAPVAPAKQQTPGGAAPSGKRKQRIVLAENNSPVPITVSFTVPIYTLPAPRPITLEELCTLQRSSAAPTEEEPLLSLGELKQAVGDQIYNTVHNLLSDPASIAALKEARMYTESCTATKIVGMFMDACSLEELQSLNANTAELHEFIMDACEELVADAQRQRNQAAQSKMQQIGWGDMIAELEATA